MRTSSTLWIGIAALTAWAGSAAIPDAAGAERAHVSVGSHQGAPALIVDGKPEIPMLFYQTVLTEKEPAAAWAAGFRVFSFVGADGVFGLSTGWIGEGRYDYTGCDRVLSTFASRVPDGYCIVRVLVSAPDWWVGEHPEEAVRFASGAEWKDNEWGGTKHESFASLRWRNEAGEAFRRFVRHVLDAPYADRVAGIHIAGGIYGEWHNWSATDLPDTSEPMRLAFVRYARAKHRDDVAALRKAWADPSATFDEIRIPSADEQHRTDVGMFRDPARGRKVIDYDESLHNVNVDAIEHFCRIVKDESEGRLLTMVLYGYVPDINWPQAGDHRAAARAMRSPLIDIVASPHTYGRRRLGEDGLFRHFPASAALHGKLFLDEGDDRTHLAPAAWPGRYAESTEQSIQIMRREFLNPLTRGCGLYYMDQSGTFFSEPELMDELGRLKRWANQAMTLPRGSTSQVAVFSSMESEFYLAGRETGRNHITQALYDAQIGELCRSGAPFDWYHIEDLEALTRSYKTYVFLDCFYLTPTQRAAIERLKSRDRTLLWLYAPGFVEHDRLSLPAMQALTGLAFEQLPEGMLQVAMEGSPSAAPTAFGFPVTQQPVFVPTGDDLKVQGRNPQNGRPAFVSRKFDGWRSVYCLTPNIPAALLREVFTEAGVHIYCESGDSISANESWIGIHAATSGEKTIRLPARSPVYDIFSEKLILRSGTEFEVELKTGETRIWMLALPPKTLRSAARRPISRAAP